MLKEPSLWNHTSSNCSTIADLKAELVNKQLVRSLHVDLALCTDPTTNKWTYETDFLGVNLPDGNLYVRAAPAPPPPHPTCVVHGSQRCAASTNGLWGWLSRHAGWGHRSNAEEKKKL